MAQLGFAAESRPQCGRILQIKIVSFRVRSGNCQLFAPVGVAKLEIIIILPQTMAAAAARVEKRFGLKCSNTIDVTGDLISKKENLVTNPRVKISINDPPQISALNGSSGNNEDVVRESQQNRFVFAKSRDFVRGNMETFKSNQLSSNIKPQNNSQAKPAELKLKQQGPEIIQDDSSGENLCIAYTTTLGIIRRTFEDSKLMR